MSFHRFKFGPARHGESIVYGAQRPGYDSHRVSRGAVQEWTAFMQAQGIQRVCCLLPPSQLSYYSVDLLEHYREAFGLKNLCHEPVEDFHLCGRVALESNILPFLAASDAKRSPVVVHCSGGSGRTGHVLAAWLVRHRGLTVDVALSAVATTCRNPREAVDSGNATEDQLRILLSGDEAQRAV